MAMVYARLPITKKKDRWPYNWNLTRLVNYIMREKGYLVDGQYRVKAFYAREVAPLLATCERELEYQGPHFPFSRNQYKSLFRVKNELPKWTSVYLLAIYRLLEQVARKDDELIRLITLAREELLSYSSFCLPGMEQCRDYAANATDEALQQYPDLNDLIAHLDALDVHCPDQAWHHLV